MAEHVNAPPEVTVVIPVYNEAEILVAASKVSWPASAGCWARGPSR